MPIAIRDRSGATEGDKGKEIAWLAEDDWKLPSQLAELEVWLRADGLRLPSGSYTIDVGFSPREGASGGGGGVSAETMALMAEKGIDLWLSEYPPFMDKFGDDE